MELKICHLYPDVLNLYGDTGNVVCLERRMAWRGLDVSVTGVRVGEALKVADYDLFFLGGGQDFEQSALMDDLRTGKDSEIRAAVADGKTFLAICGGYQILGSSYETADGQTFDFIGAMDVHTAAKKNRITGDLAFTCEEIGNEIVVGFENHAGRTYLGSSVKPLGKVIRGGGNNAEDGGEGARYNNVFASYAHGCMLPKNPNLADHILKTALQQKYGTCELPPLDDTLELAAHDYMAARLQK